MFDGFTSVKFYESNAMVDYVEDWSKVRSPARAKRRMKRGFPQNVRTIAVPNKEVITLDGGMSYYAHPETLRAMRQAMDDTNKASATHFMNRWN